MAFEVSKNDVLNRLAVPLTPEQEGNVETLIADAIEQIDVAFLKAGRNFRAELESVPWLAPEARRVVREMVSAAIIVGPHAGLSSMSTTVGAITEARGFNKSSSELVSFSGVYLTDQHREDLGLEVGGPRASFPPPPTWPEVMP